MLKLNLGCGYKLLDGYVNVDVVEGADVQQDITKGLPWLDENVDEIFSESFLEHIGPDNVVNVVNDMWRVLKPGGVAHHFIPLANTVNDLADPTHKSKWILESFRYFDKNDDKNKYYRGAIKGWSKIDAKIVEPWNHTIEVYMTK